LLVVVAQAHLERLLPQQGVMVLTLNLHQLFQLAAAVVVLVLVDPRLEGLVVLVVEAAVSLRLLAVQETRRFVLHHKATMAAMEVQAHQTTVVEAAVGIMPLVQMEQLQRVATEEQEPLMIFLVLLWLMLVVVVVERIKVEPLVQAVQV
jgi:hypothetical protein